MLREIAIVRQTDPAVRKRWFESDFFDLYLWQRDDDFVHMQLCYNRNRKDESAISWKEGAGLFHDGVEAVHRSETPLLSAGGAFDAERVNARFLRESAELPIEVRKFVLAKLHDFALHGPVKRSRPARQVVRREDWQRPDANGAGAADLAPKRLE
jgi:hypothetical protein